MRATPLILAVAALVAPALASAHCDTLDGPVVVEARAALEKGDPTPILKWVRPADEAEIRAAFGRALKVRAAGPEARELADTYFLETLVRVHRAGEGAPYDGLKPAGTADPGVVFADRALDGKNVDGLVRAMNGHIADGIRERFERTLAARAKAGDSVEAGRRYVAAYVDFMHYVERLHQVAVASGGHDHAAHQ